MRDNSIDILKGIAILAVYLGHSIIYHPISLGDLYPWCRTLVSFIQSFNMPLFFIVSGYLFSKSKKSSLEIFKDKLLRLAVPYLFTMIIVVSSKLMLPSSMSFNGGGRSIVFYALKLVVLRG